jgi:hypothetical protein
VDLKPLNTSVLQEVHPLPSVDDTLAQLVDAKVFTKLDANSGFWQVPLANNSRLLTTFKAPFGKYCFNKLPIGIASAQEVFQKHINRVLRGLEGALCLIVDNLVFGKDEKEYNKQLTAVLQHDKQSGITLSNLNLNKFEFSISEITFLVNQEGIKADPGKTSAISKMKAPTNITELRRFLGMVNQLGKFSSHLAELSHPLRELFTKNCDWAMEFQPRTSL